MSTSTLASVDKKRRLSRARRVLSGTAVPPATPIPRNASADARFIAASLNYRRCAKALIQAITAHQQFAASQPYDDAGHHDHHQRVIAARQALIGADVAFETAEEALLGGRS